MPTCTLPSLLLALSMVFAHVPPMNDRKVGHATPEIKMSGEATSYSDNLMCSPCDADSPPPPPVQYRPALSSRGLPALDHTAMTARTVTPFTSGRLGLLRADSSSRYFSRRQPVSLPTKERRRPQWLEQLSSISNAASLLCVVDCTVLPVVTLLLPLLGEVAGAGMTKTLHALGEMWAVGALSFEFHFQSI